MIFVCLKTVDSTIIYLLLCKQTHIDADQTSELIFFCYVKGYMMANIIIKQVIRTYLIRREALGAIGVQFWVYIAITASATALL